MACTYEPAKPAAAAATAAPGGVNSSSSSSSSAAPTFGGDTWIGTHLVDVFVMEAEPGQTSLMVADAFTGPSLGE